MSLDWQSPVRRKYDELAKDIAAQMAYLPWPASRISPDGGQTSTLRDSWEEFAREN